MLLSRRLRAKLLRSGVSAVLVFHRARIRQVRFVMPQPSLTCFFRRCLVATTLAWLPGVAIHAQTPPASVRTEPFSVPVALPAPLPSHIDEWVSRWHRAAKSRSYVGTLVVSSAAGALSRARIAHTCAGPKQLERVESLTGVPRITYRWGNEVHTFLPQTRTLRRENFDPAGGFPSLAQVQGTAVTEFYTAAYQGAERVAGLLADVVWLRPGDSLRFGHRIWSERDTGLVLKMQTLQADGAVLEQVAFSEVDLQAVVPLELLRRDMQATRGYRVVDVPMRKTSAAAHGWVLRQSVPGFVLVHCYAHNSPSPVSRSLTAALLQCTYSDGLASVSLFIEPEGRADPGADTGTAQRIAGRWSMGATHVLSQPVGSEGWLTAVGEVPHDTLLQLAQGLERLR